MVFFPPICTPGRDQLNHPVRPGFLVVKHGKLKMWKKTAINGGFSIAIFDYQ